MNGPDVRAARGGDGDANTEVTMHDVIGRRCFMGLRARF
jgi:hypothetical protein